MSVLSTLALLVTAASAKLRPAREDPARAIADLEAQRDELRRERDDWRARAEAWRARAITNIPPTQELQWYAARPQYHQAQQQLAQQNQAYQQQNAQMAQQNLYQQGLLGAQGLNPELFCNCVPSRAQVWAARPGDGA